MVGVHTPRAQSTGVRHRSTRRLLSDWPSAPRPGVPQDQNSQGTARLRAGGLGGAGWTLGPSHSHLTPHRYAGRGPQESSLWKAQRKITQRLTISCCLSWRRAGSPRLQLWGAMSVTSVLSARRARGLPWVLALRSRDPEAKGDCHPATIRPRLRRGTRGLSTSAVLAHIHHCHRPATSCPSLHPLGPLGPRALLAPGHPHIQPQPQTSHLPVKDHAIPPEMLCGWGQRGLCCWR